MTLLPIIDPPMQSNKELAEEAASELAIAIKNLEAALAMLDEAGWSEGFVARNVYEPLCKAADIIEKAAKTLQQAVTS